MFVKLDDKFLSLEDISMSQRVILAHIYALNSRCEKFIITNDELCTSLHLNNRSLRRDLIVLSEKGYIVIETLSTRHRTIRSKRYLFEKSQELTQEDKERLQNALNKRYNRRPLS